MKKNYKVIVIKARCQNGNDRTVQGVVPLNVTVNDIIKAKNLSPLSIVSTKVSAPMTFDEATVALTKGFAAIALAPDRRLVKVELTSIAA